MFRYELAILIIFFKHNLSLKICLRYLQANLSRPGVDKLLHLTIALVNSSSENDDQIDNVDGGILLRTSSSI